MRLLILLAGFWLGSAAVVSGQAAGPTYFQFTYQNDYFAATDYYFTQGLRFQYAAPWVRRSPLTFLLPSFTDDPTIEHSLFLAQDGYTPTSIRADTLLRGDRPYAGALYLGQQAISSDPADTWRLRTTLLLGVIGPRALAGEEQEYIHRQLGNVLPMGWRFQIANDLILNYEVELDRSLYHSRWLGLSGGGHAWLGTYRTRAGGQVAARLGWIGVASGKRATAKATRLFLFGAGRLSAIGYDASLQGGLFNRSSIYTIPAREIERFVASLEWGVQFRSGKLGIAFSRTYLSPEFRGGRRHGWGTVGVVWGPKL